ncbi:MAG: N-acetylmuramoyl-L-alanine amidase [Epsilonproteobacteria bacterium]|nr:MAG: N-acetylmuramoyl-L-alanine amidase [Campylobacterota bacterium]
MSIFVKFLLFILLGNSLLFSANNTLQKALVKDGELQLFFSKSFKKYSVKHFKLKKPYREIYDFKNTRIGHSRVPLGLGENVRIAQNTSNTVRVVIYTNNSHKSSAYQPLFSGDEYRISLDKNMPKVKNKTVKKTSKTKKTPKKQNIYTKHTNELIVIDAGHGGHDSGAIGGGKREKDVVLQIAKRLEKKLKKKGYSVHMTRSKDKFLKLPQRTKIADQKNAIVFVSIHANSVSKKKRHKIHGVETFFLQNTRDEKSQRIAARENKAVLKGAGSKLSKEVIVDSVLNGPKIVQSNKLAIDVQRRIISNLRSKYTGIKDGGVRHAPFWVLVGASRPSILVEVGYISHPKERKRLFTPSYQELLAKGITQGIEIYLNNRKKEIDF